VQAGPGVADLAREQRLERGLAVLEIERHRPFATGVGLPDLAESRPHRLEIGAAQQAAVVQHLGVGDGGLHVVGDQAVVEGVVLAGRVAQHALVERRTLVPESRH